MQVFRDLQESGADYMFFLHDYWPVCKVRLFYPMLAKCKTCYRKENWVPILAGAGLLVWLSPLHRKSWLYMCPELRRVPCAIIPSTVDPEMFYDMKLPRAGNVAVNSGVEFKGRYVFYKYAEDRPREQFTLVGQADGRPPQNVKLVGQVAYQGMNALYNSHETFVHLPENPMPFDRTIVEALLAGCKVVSNKNVGALSWPEIMSGDKDGIKVLMKSANSSFWAMAERVL